MLKEYLGFFTMCLGGMAGDSENLAFPIMLILVGAWLIFSKPEE